MRAALGMGLFWAVDDCPDLEFVDARYPANRRGYRLFHFARAAKGSEIRPAMSQETGKLRFNGFALRRHHLLEEAILHVLRQVSQPNDGLTQRPSKWSVIATDLGVAIGI